MSLTQPKRGSIKMKQVIKQHPVSLYYAVNPKQNPCLERVSALATNICSILLYLQLYVICNFYFQLNSYNFKLCVCICVKHQEMQTKMQRQKIDHRLPRARDGQGDCKGEILKGPEKTTGRMGMFIVLIMVMIVWVSTYVRQGWGVVRQERTRRKLLGRGEVFFLNLGAASWLSLLQLIKLNMTLFMSYLLFL